MRADHPGCAFGPALPPASLSSVVMHARKLLAGGVAAAGLVGLLVAFSWSSRCPVQLKVVGIVPSGTMDDDRSESWLVTLWRYSWSRALAARVFPVGWQEPLRSDFVGRSPHWRRMDPDVALPRGPAGPSGRVGRAHNEKSGRFVILSCFSAGLLNAAAVATKAT